MQTYSLIRLFKFLLVFATIGILLIQCTDSTDDPAPETEPPEINSINPGSGTVGTEVTIDGLNFSASASGNEVSFNGATASVTSASTTQLIVEVPTDATTGDITVTVDGSTTRGPVFTVEEEDPANVYDCSQNIISSDTEWVDIVEGDAVDYVINCAITVNNDALLTIGPGVIIQFEGDESGIFTSDGGGLLAVGSEEEPIIMMGTSATAGIWKGIYFSSTNPQNRLEFVEVRHAGRTASAQTDEKGAVQLTRGEEARASIVNCKIEENDGYGLLISENSNLQEFSNNIIHNNVLAPVSIFFNQLGKLDESSAYALGNGQPYIEVHRNPLEDESSLAKLDVPYRFVENNRYYVQNGLNIAAGATLEFVSGSALRLGEQASDCSNTSAYFNAVGTAEEPITFKGVVEGSGSWLGIGINSSSPNNQLIHCNINGAGAARIFNASHENGAVVLQCESMVRIQNTTISESAGHAVTIHDEDATLNEFSDNELTNNEASPIALYFHQLDQLDVGSSYEEGNQMPYIKVIASVLAENDMTVPALELPYRVGLNDRGRLPYIEKALTLNPGVVMEFETASGIKLGNPGADCVDNTGSFTAIGTEDNPIILRGVSEGQGTWKGIGINSNTSLNQLTYCEISGGGSGQMYNAGGEGNIVMQCGASLKMENCLIMDSGSWGVDFVNGNNSLDQTSNTFGNNASGNIASQ